MVRFERPLPAGLQEDIMGGIFVIGIGLLLFIALILFAIVGALAAAAKGADVLMHTDPKTGRKI
jgi:hypothetical protein